MNKAPLVSIILPTFNRANYLERSIKSILNQTYTNFELIIIDDGSTDNTDEILNGFNEDRIQIIERSHNGASYARNFGISIAKGNYIAFQDSDDEWMPNKLDKQINIILNEDIRADVVYSDMWRISNNSEKYWASPDVRLGNLIDPITMDYQVYGIGIGSAIIKRECFIRGGNFDERLKRFIDMDLFIRFSKIYRFYHIKKPLVKYYETEGISSNLNELCISRLLLLQKYYNDVKINDKFILNQYEIIIRALQEQRNQTSSIKTKSRIYDM
jgi:glycosyltransferase involved in cell wall biosynthesis